MLLTSGYEDHSKALAVVRHRLDRPLIIHEQRHCCTVDRESTSLRNRDFRENQKRMVQLMDCTAELLKPIL